MFDWIEYKYKDDWTEYTERWMDIIKWRNTLHRQTTDDTDLDTWQRYLDWIEEYDT